ncbi:MAG: phosphatidate cytidylyltransferase [Clostridia bacterium]|nr:phosphatidate cytidylyltransferase [Clostridia bacterium]
MLGTRILVALVGSPLLLIAAYLGEWWLSLLVAMLTFFCLKEFYSLVSRLKLKPLLPVGFLGCVFVLIITYLNRDMASWLGSGLSVSLLVIFLIFFPRIGIGDLAATLLGIWYIGVSLAYLPLIRFLPYGMGGLILTFLLTWVNDTGAYFSGRLFGRYHPWPNLSPGKTLAGVFGGLIGTIILALVLGPLLIPVLNKLLLIGLATLVSIAAQAGDLIESGFKRKANIKDSGDILLGHGGFLDRFDSLLLVAPVVYYYLVFFLPT